MTASIIVADASPLIALAKLGRLEYAFVFARSPVLDVSLVDRTAHGQFSRVYCPQLLLPDERLACQNTGNG